MKRALAVLLHALAAAAALRAPAAPRSAVRMNLKRKDDRMFADERSLLGRTMAEQEGGDAAALFPGGDEAMPDVSEYTNARRVAQDRAVGEAAGALDKFRGTPMFEEEPDDGPAAKPAKRRARRSRPEAGGE